MLAVLQYVIVLCCSQGAIVSTKITSLHALGQGTAAVVLAGILAAQPLTGKGLAEHDIMIAGDSAAGTAIAELLAEAIARQSRR